MTNEITPWLLVFFSLETVAWFFLLKQEGFSSWPIYSVVLSFIDGVSAWGQQVCCGTVDGSCFQTGARWLWSYIAPPFSTPTSYRTLADPGHNYAIICNYHSSGLPMPYKPLRFGQLETSIVTLLRTLATKQNIPSFPDTRLKDLRNVSSSLV